MSAATVKSALGGIVLVAAAVVPALLTALPARIELRRSRAEALAAPAPEAATLFASEEASRRTESQLLPSTQEAARLIAEGAPAWDAADDRRLYLMETAAATEAEFVSSEPLEKAERVAGGYAFHTVALKAAGTFASIHAFLSALERGGRLLVVVKATLRRDASSEHPHVLLDARIVFAERIDAPDPEVVLRRSAPDGRSGR